MRTGEPFLLRYTVELIQLVKHGGSMPLWHIPQKFGGMPKCWQRTQHSRIKTVAMFDEPPPNMCPHCLKFKQFERYKAESLTLLEKTRNQKNRTQPQ